MRRFSRCIALFVAVLLASLSLLPGQPAKKKGTQYALLVAGSGYNEAHLKPLPFTINDIEEFKKVLLATGFEEENIKVLHDKRTERRYVSEKAKVLKELDLLLDGLREEDTVVVALSGHGVHFKGDKTGYFCPIDAKLDNKATLIPMDGKGGLFEQLKSCKAKRKLLLVNACRNDPASDLAQAARKVELDDEDADVVPEGIAALYSCKAGQKCYCDPKRQRGIFFDHVIRAWKGEYHKGSEPLKLENVFEQVISRTKADADRTFEEKQVPDARREYSGEWLIGASKAKEVVVDLGGGVKMEFVLIPAGKFTMGSPKDEKDRKDDEEQHEVEITRDFYLGKYKVTQEQYQRLTGENPSYFAATGTDADYKERVKGKDTSRFPVENVRWTDATAFCEKLTEKHGEKRRRFGLPSEAEWEYACRAGTLTPFHFGKVCNGKQANCNGNYPYGTDEKGPYLERTCPVGEYAANAWGLYDMSGNVYEWCQDWYGPYADLKRRDPLREDPIKDKKSRVLRGGSWSYLPWSCRAAFRRNNAPAYRDRYVGFRVAFRLD